MVQAEIEALLRKKIGLDVNTIGSTKLARAIDNRRIACHLPDVEGYLQLLRTSSQELAELIENIVIPETWFFRDRNPFSFLKSYITSQWYPQHLQDTLRLLSIPCCTGEEPYSLAMTLLDAGLAPSKFRIDGIDISKQSISKAENATYSKNSFRGEDISYQQRYFQEIAQRYILTNTVRNTVNFRIGNILEPFLLGQNQYDIIFCRNLLIYLDNSSRTRVIEVLDRALVPGGLLFVGSAETAIVSSISDRFTSIHQPFTFAYQKNQSYKPSSNNNSKLEPNSTPNIQNSSQKQNKKYTALTTVKPIQLAISQPSPQPQKPPPPPKSTTTPQNSANPVSLLTARTLANQGNLEEAATICHNYLQQHSTNAEAYLLLGEIHQGLSKNDLAEQYYQKVLYLNPNHYEALTHLALLREHRGDAQGAKLIRQRIQRIMT